MKSEFKVGDLVEVKKAFFRRLSRGFTSFGIGRVIQIDRSGCFVKIQWPGPHAIKNGWWNQSNLELAESPIQRMKRLYSEEK